MVPSLSETLSLSLEYHPELKIRKVKENSNVPFQHYKVLINIAVLVLQVQRVSTEEGLLLLVNCMVQQKPGLFH